jgi:hypothetical protein
MLFVPPGADQRQNPRGDFLSANQDSYNLWLN